MKTAPFFPRLAPFLAGAISFIYLMHLSWLKWGDLIIDTGRELEVPARLAQGDILYRDVFYLYGPFSPYFNALIYKIFGTHLLPVIMAGLLVAGLTTVMVYRLSRLFLSRFFATLTALQFLFVLCFNHHVYLANYTFVLPYSFPATHGILFALCALYFFMKKRKRDTLFSRNSVSLFLFLCLVTRLEIGIMLGTSLLAGIALRRDWRNALAVLLWPFLAALGLLAGFWLASGGHLGRSNLLDLWHSNVQVANPFISWLSGAGALTANLMTMLKSLSGYVSTGGIALLCGFLLTKAKGTDWKRRAAQIFIVLAGLAGLWFLTQTFLTADIQYRALPFFLTVGILFGFLRDPRLAVLCLFSLLMILRMVLHVHPGHYGFYLLVPGLIALGVLTFRIVPGLLKSELLRKAWTIGFACVFVLLGWQQFTLTRYAYNLKTMKMETPRGTIIGFPDDRTIGSADLVNFLYQHTKPEDKVVVFPEGLAINFFAGRPNPLYDYSFLPQDLTDPALERSIVGEMKQKRVDYVVILNRPVQEYGRQGFGIDYAHIIWSHIREDYEPIASLGPQPYTSPHFGFTVYKLKPAD